MNMGKSFYILEAVQTDEIIQIIGKHVHSLEKG